MKQLLIAVLVSAIFTSCATSNEPPTKKVLVKEYWKSSIDYSWYQYEGLKVQRVDTMYHVGDTLPITGTFGVLTIIIREEGRP